MKVEEVRKYIRNARRRNATCPDEIPIELFKEIVDDDEAMNHLTNQLNQWWNEADQIPDELLSARIVLIFEGGSTKLTQQLSPNFTSQHHVNHMCGNFQKTHCGANR
jgi:hypothetical protein